MSKQVLPKPSKKVVERVQIGVRLEKRMAQVLKAFSKRDGIPVGHILEDIVNHAVWGASTFSGVRTRPPAEREAFKTFLKKAGYIHTAHSPLRFVEKDSDVPWDVSEAPLKIQRIALGVRMEKSMVKVLKALAELCNGTLEQMLEDIIAHALEGVSTFPEAGNPDPRAKAMHRKILALMNVYGMDYDVHDHMAFVEGKR